MSFVVMVLAVAVLAGCIYVFGDAETRGGIPIGVIAFFTICTFLVFFFM